MGEDEIRIDVKLEFKVRETREKETKGIEPAEKYRVFQKSLCKGSGLNFFGNVPEK